MIPDEAPPAPIGHNQPPSMIEAGLSAQREAQLPYLKRKDEFLRAAQAAVVRDRTTAAAAGDVVKLAGEVWDRIESDRMDRTRPYRDTAQAITQEAIEFWAPVEDEMARLRGMIDAWVKGERKRIADQRREQEAEMARLLADAEPAAPPAPPPPPSPAPKPRRVRGDYGSVISAADRTVYEIVDVRALPDHILNAPAVRDAILLVVRQTAKHMGVPTGIRTDTVAETQIR